MWQFRAIFFHESRTISCWRNVIILALLVILLQYGVYKGIWDHQSFIAKSREFQANERLNFKNMVNDINFSDFGVQVLFLPTASGLFFSYPPLMFEVSGNINSIVTLNIRNNSLGKSLFESSSIYQDRGANILFFLGSLAALFIGVGVFRNRDHLKLLCSFNSCNRIYAFVIISRLILIMVLFLLLCMLMMIPVLLESVALTQSDVPYLTAFIIVFILQALFFFFLGTIIRFVCSPWSRLGVLLAAWILLIVIVPGLFQSIIEEEANVITSHYKLHADKLNIVTNFEKEVKEKAGKFAENGFAVFRDLLEKFRDNGFKLIEAKDEDYKKQIQRVIKKYYLLFGLTPPTLYKSTTLEISSRGYGNFLDFFSYLQELRRHFFQSRIDRVYYNDPKALVNFVKENENLFQSRPGLPENFGYFVLLNLGYILGLMIASFLLFRRLLYKPEENEPVKKGNPAILLKKSLLKVLWVIRDPKGFSERLYNLLSGKFPIYHKKECALEVKMADVDYTDNRAKLEFVYVHHPDRLPKDLRVKDYIGFFARLLKLTREQEVQVNAAPGITGIKRKYIGKLKREDRGNVLLAVLPYIKKGIYLVDVVSRDMSVEYIIRLNGIMKGWTESGAAVLFLTLERDVNIGVSVGINNEINFNELDLWSETVSRLNELGYTGK
ncbi:MAG: hypothetical protein QG657_2729 [Acidobacteriota bacterium]|nr:hypothetical protein [Acidobacteriota bacterium]